jgi:lycopene cyclase domain-containing protein
MSHESYWALNAFFLAAAVAVAVFAAVRVARSAPDARGRVAASAGLALAALLVFTAVFDNVMIAVGLVAYDRSLVSGVLVGIAPIEDFAYALAAGILLPSLWVLLAPQRAGAPVIRQLLLSSRPLSWVNTAYPFAAAYLLTVGHVDWLFVIGTLYFLVPYNLAMYGINDVFDYESDLRNPRKGGVEGAVLDRSLHRATLWAVLIVNVPFVVVLVLAGSSLSWIVLAVSLFAVVAYSAPGLRFKERPFLDSITSSTHFVSPAVFGLALAGASVAPGLIAVLAAYFLWGVASHAFGAVQDIVADREGGIGSIATVIGATATVRFSFAAYLVSGALLLLTPWPGPLAAVLALPYAASVLPFWSLTDAQAETANRGWKRFLWLNYVTGFLVTLLFIGVFTGAM